MNPSEKIMQRAKEYKPLYDLARRQGVKPNDTKADSEPTLNADTPILVPSGEQPLAQDAVPGKDDGLRATFDFKTSSYELPIAITNDHEERWRRVSELANQILSGSPTPLQDSEPQPLTRLPVKEAPQAYLEFRDLRIPQTVEPVGELADLFDIRTLSKLVDFIPTAHEIRMLGADKSRTTERLKLLSKFSKPLGTELNRFEAIRELAYELLDGRKQELVDNPIVVESTYGRPLKKPLKSILPPNIKAILDAYFGKADTSGKTVDEPERIVTSPPETVDANELSLEELTALARSIKPEDRILAARNEKTPRETLIALSQDLDNGVKQAALENKTTPMFF